MNLYFSSVASQPSSGHLPHYKVNQNTKYSGYMNNYNQNKPHNTLVNAIGILTGHNQLPTEESNPTSINVELRRTSPDSPWGFRIQGGSDYHLQLTVCKTQSGSPSEGVLQSGDAIMLINGESTRNLSHEEATNKIRTSGTDLQLTVTRKHSCDLTDIRPKGQIKFTAPTNLRR